MILSGKKYNLFDYVLFLLPIIDVLNTIVGMRLSLVIRSLILAFLTGYLFFVNKSKNKRKYINIFFVICFFAGSYLIHNYFINGLSNVVNEFISLIKFIYLPLLTLCLYAYYEDKKLDLTNIISKIAYLYSFLIIVPTVLGFGLKSYDLYKFGYSGLFYSPNEISNILAIVFPFAVFNLFNNKKNILSYILVCIFILSCFVLGTKTPFLGLCLTLFAMFVIYLIRFLFIRKDKKDSVRGIILTIIIFIFTIVCYNNSYLKTNLNLQDINYGELNNLPNNDEEKDNGNNESGNVGNNSSSNDNGTDKIIVENKVPTMNFNTENINFPNYQEEIVDNKILNLIFSSRNIYLQNNLNKMKRASLSHKLLGITTGNNTNMSELDLCDIYIYYGIIGVIVFLGYIIYLFIVAMFKILFKFKSNIMDNDVLATFISFGVGLLIALTAGHTLSAPAVSVFLSLNIVYLIKKLNIKFRLFKLKKLNNILIIIYILVISFSIITLDKGKYNLTITINDNNIEFNNEVSKLEEKTIEYNGIKDTLTYYSTDAYSNIKVIYVLREFDEDNQIHYFTVNNNGSLEVLIDFENETFNNEKVYVYTLNDNDVKVFNESLAKNLIRVENTENKISLKQGESFDTYFVNSDKEINNENMWLTYKGIYNELKDRIYIRDLSNDFYVKGNELLNKNYLVYLYEYAANLDGIWYKDYLLKKSTNVEYNSIYFDLTLNYKIYRTFKNLNIENKIINKLSKQIKEGYDNKKYFSSRTGIVFDKLVVPVLKEQIAITNILLESYKDKKDNKTLKIINQLLDEITSSGWEVNNNLYEFLDYDLLYKGMVNDIEVLENYIYLYDNLNDTKLSKKYNIESKIKILLNKFGVENLNNELKSILKVGDFID